jgi:hypothetical protein
MATFKSISAACALFAVTAISWLPSPATADDSPITDSAQTRDEATEEHTERTDPAFYRGRSRNTTAEEVLLWIPRVIFAPLYLVTEYIIRLPIYALLEWADRNHVFDLIELVFNPTEDFSWTPSLSFETGGIVLPGASAEWRNMLVPGHDARLAFSFAGTDFFAASLRDRWSFGPLFLGARGGYLTRPDRAFHGLGPRSGNERTNFSETRVEAFAFVGVEYENYVDLEVTAGVSRERIGTGMEPSMQTRFPANRVPGYGSFDLALGTLDLTVDSRREVEENGGVRFRAVGSYGFDPSRRGLEFTTVALDLEGAIEISHPDRVLAARVYWADTIPLGAEPVPFLHLATLGWDNHRGFRWGRFRGDAALMAEVRYRYPINYFVDLQWIASAGNVFARDFSDFSWGALTASFGVGLRTRRTGADPIEATFAIGTSRFENDFAIDSVRFQLTTTRSL